MLPFNAKLRGVFPFDFMSLFFLNWHKLDVNLFLLLFYLLIYLKLLIVLLNSLVSILLVKSIDWTV